MNFKKKSQNVKQNLSQSRTKLAQNGELKGEIGIEMCCQEGEAKEL